MVKFVINGECCVAAEKREQNIAYARSLGLPYVSERKRPPLAVLGGGHSIAERITDHNPLWRFADRWIIGSAFQWWASHDVDGTFFSVHPSPMALNNIAGVKRALLATVTAPSVFDALIAQGAEIEIFDVENAGSTTATAAPYLSVGMGYRDVTFYGCDSSYPEKDGQFFSHAYMSAEDPFLMRVKCNGQEFLTGAEFLMQAECLSTIIRAVPLVYKERSGGLLRAMIADPVVDTQSVSKTLYAGAGLAA